MSTMRPGPNKFAVAGASCRTHIRLKAICSKPPCNQEAERTVHHRSNEKTGMAPLAPNRKRLLELGERNEKAPPIVTPCGSAANVNR